jgi:hypothetical protein
VKLPTLSKLLPPTKFNLTKNCDAPRGALRAPKPPPCRTAEACGRLRSRGIIPGLVFSPEVTAPDFVRSRRVSAVRTPRSSVYSPSVSPCSTARGVAWEFWQEPSPVLAQALVERRCLWNHGSSALLADDGGVGQSSAAVIVLEPLGG